MVDRRIFSPAREMAAHRCATVFSGCGSVGIIIHDGRLSSVSIEKDDDRRMFCLIDGEWNEYIESVGGKEVDR